ncbi:cytochrome c, class I [Afipia carboxidovorans OM5]|uniref:Cytochrome c, class I n=1 Tax=Afipia carboxidovorans (strain ATCC 49405 / DSM 1227 / KCTC 32145 / OM5) TaxID=504832 RepID=F8BSH0_AFIC5|nr:cytochrome c [Afipia carboxidovorans]AEI03636.1 cytochrome c, class I [Afipia carboxidovorans OM4]AEI07213.1 cytochrome c, class I [Afipia carboxidovorans OM5]
MKNKLPLATAVITAALLSTAHAADKLDASCASCHALTKPTDTSIERIINRKGPDLWYAGSKFNADWLTAWLQDPKPIRPAGYPYFKVIKEGPEHDVPDASKITAHPKLAKAAAESATAALMALKTPDLVPAGAFKGDAAGARMGALAFTKLRGCITCHQGEDGKGGFSGPELTNAGARLQPDFIAAYTADPQRFDPHIWMPTLTLKDQDIQRLTAYLSVQGRGDKK